MVVKYFHQVPIIFVKWTRICDVNIGIKCCLNSLVIQFRPQNWFFGWMVKVKVDDSSIGRSQPFASLRKKSPE